MKGSILEKIEKDLMEVGLYSKYHAMEYVPGPYDAMVEVRDEMHQIVAVIRIREEDSLSGIQFRPENNFSPEQVNIISQLMVLLESEHRTYGIRE